MKRIIICCICIMLFFSVTINALTEEEYKQKKEQIQKKINENKEKISAEKEKLKDLKEDAESLDNQINALNKELSTLEQNISDLNNQIAASQEEILSIEKDLEGKEKLLIERLKAMQLNGEAGYISVLLNSKSIEEYLNNKDLIQMMAKADKDLIEKINELKLEKEKAKINLENSRDQLNVEQNRLKESRAKAEKLKQDKLRYVKETETNIALRQREIEKFNEQSKKLEATIIRNSTGGVFIEGKFNWPLPGRTRISSPYGNRPNPFGTGRMEFHTGIDIPAPTGETARASASGTVIYAGWLSSYGNLVVIDHGGGYSTAYAHNSKILVSVGQKVAAGQTIALIGSTGYSTGPHMHFEVRRNGKHTNPLNWVRP